MTTVAVAPSGESSLAAVLSQATSGSVQQVSQLLSLSGTTLDLAATLLTVSVLSGNFESESGGGAVGTVGLGQPVGQPKGNGGSERFGRGAERGGRGLRDGTAGGRADAAAVGAAVDRAGTGLGSGAGRDPGAGEPVADGGGPKAIGCARGQPAAPATGSRAGTTPNPGRDRDRVQTGRVRRSRSRRRVRRRIGGQRPRAVSSTPRWRTWVLSGQAMDRRPTSVGGSGTCWPRVSMRAPRERWLPSSRRLRRWVPRGR